MNKTLNDLLKSNTDELSFGGYTVGMLRTFAKEHIDYLRKQEKLHWEWVSMSVGEHPSFTLPDGFDFDNSYALPFGYKDIIKWIQITFNLEVDKDENT